MAKSGKFSKNQAPSPEGKQLEGKPVRASVGPQSSRWKSIKAAIEDSGRPPTVLAAEAGVAPRLLAGVRKEVLDQLSRESEGKHQVALGLGGSLSRLVIYLEKNGLLELSHEDRADWDMTRADDPDYGRKIVLKRFLVAFGFSENNLLLEPAIAAAVKQARLRRSQGLDDPVTTAILERGNVYRPCLLEWPPYTKPYEKEKESPGFANRIMRGLFSSMMPWAECDLSKGSIVQNISDAIDDLVSTPPRRDAMFALYIDPSRMGEGLEFLEVPAVVGHLGVVVRKGLLDELLSSSTTKLEAPDVRKNARHDGDEGLRKSSAAWFSFFGIENPNSSVTSARGRVLVIDREIGHAFIQRVSAQAGDSKWEIKTTTSWNTKELASRLAEERAEKPQTMFIAEWNMCRKIVDEYNKSHGADDGVEMVPYHPKLTPCYRTGIAYRADATMLASRLRTALSDDLLGQSLYQTASWYVDLLDDKSDQGGDADGELPPILKFTHDGTSIRLLRAIAEIARATSSRQDKPERFLAVLRKLARDKHIALALFSDSVGKPDTRIPREARPAWLADCENEVAEGGLDLEVWLRRLKSVLEDHSQS